MRNLAPIIFYTSALFSSAYSNECDDEKVVAVVEELNVLPTYIDDSYEDISLSQFGGLADDLLYDDTAIRSALAFASQKGKVRIVLDEGVYKFKDAIHITSSYTFIVGTSQNTVLKFDCSSTCMKLPSKVSNISASGRVVSPYAWQGGAISVFCEESCETATGRKYLNVYFETREKAAAYYFSKDGAGENIRQHASYFIPDSKVEKALVSSIMSNVAITAKDIHVNERRVIDGVGLSNITIRFNKNRYSGHFKEAGYNAIYAKDVVHLNLDNVLIENAQNGVLYHGDRGYFNNIKIVKNSGATPFVGHHALALLGSQNVLNNLDIQGNYVHGLTLNGKSQYNRVDGITGSHLNIDFHRGGVAYNHISGLEFSDSKRPWASGGGMGNGKHLGAGNIVSFSSIAKNSGVPKSPFYSRTSCFQNTSD